MRIVADLHIHSRHSRATSREMEVETLARWARWKGVNLLGKGEFPQTTYFAELRAKLTPQGNGLYSLKRGDSDVSFMLTVEVANVYSQGGRQRRIHTLIFAPSLEVAARINGCLGRLGKLASDGRPMFGCSARDLAKMVLDLSPECALVPAHAWTPWYSVFGANSGFDSLEECYGEAAGAIFAIETGLSSDPAMNWRWSALDRIALISNSDAHSPSRIAREANVFETEPGYQAVLDAIRTKDPSRFLFTIEFFPEEGKYHYDGHRECKVLWAPAETRRHGGRCPVCGRPVTVGVMHRVESLSDRSVGYAPPRAIPAKHLVPLAEIIGEALEIGAESAGVGAEWRKLVAAGGSELAVLMDLPEADLARFTPPKILEGIRRVRAGQLSITPGYDGVYGKVSLFGAASTTPAESPASQLAL
ncbi:MAG: endonuclease Q family protein, partial [candidate division NC10 bacterium]